MYLHPLRLGYLVVVIYNSRNFICIYTLDEAMDGKSVIYNSRNFICIYTRRSGKGGLTYIYNSRNFICICTSDVILNLNHSSTIVEILYVFAPFRRGNNANNTSTIVEIL